MTDPCNAADQVLVVDAGHTRVKFACCRPSPSLPLPEVVRTQAFLYESPIEWESIGEWFSTTPPSRVVVTGTNVQRAQGLVALWPASLPAPFLLLDKSSLPLSVDVVFPRKVGIDRLLNSIAANVLRQPCQPAIIVDSGTAITVDLVDGTGTFRGGAILPGIILGAKSLHAETTTLPYVDVWELLRQEPAPLGRCTETAISSGLYWGHLGAVKELVSRLENTLPTGGPEPLLLLTGGASGILSPYLQQACREPELSLQGLAVVAFQMSK